MTGIRLSTIEVQDILVRAERFTITMSRIAAPKCQQEGCQNPTWYGFCHHHQSQSGSNAAPSVGVSPQTPSLSFLHYSNVSDLWSDMLGAFPDAGEVVHPRTIRQEAFDTLSAAVDAEAYRRFPALNVADYGQREALVAEMRERLVDDLLPEASTVTGEEARELSYSSADQYGRSAEDSRYLASYALNAEWECARILGEQVDPSFEQFVQRSVPEMRDAIDLSFRRNLASFDEIIRQTTGNKPLNPNPVAPHLAVAEEVVPPENDVIQGEVTHQSDDVAGDVADWFEQQRRSQSMVQQPAANETGVYSHADYYPPQPQHDPGQQQEPAPSVVGSIVNQGINMLKYYIDDPDGKRIAAKKRREDLERERLAKYDEDLDRKLKESLLRQRERRARGW